MMLTKVEGPNVYGNKVYTFDTQYTVEVPQRYEVQEVIGRGAYGIVCSAVNTENGEYVAIKKVSGLFEDAVDAKRLLREIMLLGFLDHPYVLKLRDLFKPHNPETFSTLYIVTQLMETDMQALLRSPKVRMKAGHCQYFTLQLLCALQYLHSAHVIHRDLKPGNLLTDADCNLKLCDFGLARGMGENMTHYVVTRWYRPPELLLVCKEYSYSIDLWAAGCLAAEMITGKPLLAGRDYINQLNLTIELLGMPDVKNDLPGGVSEEALKYLNSLPPSRPVPLHVFAPDLRRRFDDSDFFDSFDEEEDNGSEAVVTDGEGASRRPRLSPAQYYDLFVDFLFGLLKYNPSKRLTAKQAVAHPWLADVRGERTEVEGCEANRQFSWAYDDKPLTIAELRPLFVHEIKGFNERLEKERSGRSI